MYKDSKRTCTAIVLLIKPFVYCDLSVAVAVVVFLKGSFSKPRRRWPGERHQTKGLMSRTMAVHARFETLYINFFAVLCKATT